METHLRPVADHEESAAQLCSSDLGLSGLVPGQDG
jgi:hypothetical protein